MLDEVKRYYYPRAAQGTDFWRDAETILYNNQHDYHNELHNKLME